MGTLRHTSPDRRRWVPSAIKVGSAVALAAALYYQLAVARSFGDLWGELRVRIAAAPAWMPVAIALLVPVNLALEAVKFRLLLPPSRRPGFAQAFARVCAGLTVGMFTPNRIGEYLGRLTHAYPGERVATVVATLLGGAAQWLPLLWGGALAAVCWPLITGAPAPIRPGQLALAGLFGAGLLAASLRLASVVEAVGRATARVIRRLPAGSWLARRATTLRTRLLSLGHASAQRPRDLRRALALASLRYGVYLTQLTLAFLYCGLGAPALAAITGTAAILLAQSFIPLPALAQAMARVELAAFLWGAYAPNEVGLATASLLIFVLNLGLPAFLGLGVILRSDVAQTLGPTPLRELQCHRGGPSPRVVRSGD